MAAASELLHAAEDSLDVWTRSDLLREVADANDSIGLGLALMRLGVSAPVSFDNDIWSTISDEFYSEYEEVSDMAVWACSYAPYQEYRSDLEELAENAPSEKVRSRARMVVGFFDSLGIA